MYEEILKEIGLTKSEIAVYFALLDLGASTTEPIIKKAEIASGKAYIILNTLAQKGLVTYSITTGKKHYQAKDPERLIDYIKDKEKDLKQKEEKLREILPNLKIKYEEKKHNSVAEVFESNNGFFTFYESILKESKKGDTIYVMGVSMTAYEKFNAYLLDWNKRRVLLGINLKIIYHQDCRVFGKSREKMRLTEVRYMPKSIETPTWIDIFEDYIATINIHGVPMVFLMKDKDSAESYKKYFDMAWKASKK